MVEPRDAATVLLLRPAPGAADEAFEVFVMVRRTSMAFAGGLVAFPGGGAVPGESPRANAVRELAEETGVVLDPAALGAWDAWTTPEVMPRRYRTWFFAALLPTGQEARELSTESSAVAWIAPGEALDRVDAGEWDMMPPTYAALLRLVTYPTAEAVMEATVDAEVEMFLPTWTETGPRLPAWAQELAAARPGARWL
ncbi:MAG: NUDIX hydrolase [Nocardioides sp.]|uniref:NUDIX hydrolase n=1 Tax=Nocardioides sp. TaxID=35761 RepID=UPI0039E6FBE6